MAPMFRCLGARFTGGTAKVSSGELLRDCCIRWPPDWLNCGGYFVNRNGSAWTVEAAVAEFERTNGSIGDAVTRAELVAIRVYVQIEWEITI